MTADHPLPKPGPGTLQRRFAETRALFIAQLQDARGVHLETILGGLGAVAGCLMLRSTGVALDQLQPSGAVFVSAVDEVGPRYFDYLAKGCAELGLDPKEGWTDVVPEAHQPLKSVFELLQILELPYARLCDGLEVLPEESIRLALFTAACLIFEGKEILDPRWGKAIVLSAMVAGAKTVPPVAKS